ncbi:MAG: hypothetical protein LW687_07675, partial [Burkholderiaceae bacterium]|nr:hypothetical protein [Burkholderiaceae bacterium]
AKALCHGMADAAACTGDNGGLGLGHRQTTPEQRRTVGGRSVVRPDGITLPVGKLQTKRPEGR